MTLLYIGLVLWIGLHLFKRALPGARAALGAAIGEKTVRGVLSLAFFAAIALMVIGYRAAPVIELYQTPGWMVHVNNTLMLVAVFLMGAGHGKGRVRAVIRHPMLAGVLVWALAHLLVNGDVASVILFGAMGSWAVVNMLLINLREGPWTRPEGGTLSGDIRSALIALVIYGIIAGIHMYIGPSPFGGN